MAAEIRMKTITIKPCKDFVLLVQVNSFQLHDIGHSERIARFHQGTARPNELLADLNLSYRSTAAASTAQTPAAERILLEMELLGIGGFGKCTRMWDVSTGQCYACKTPINIPNSSSKRKDLLRKWKREIDIGRTLDHDHIVRLVDFKYEPVPSLTMDYFPLGNLRAQRPFSYSELCQVLVQCFTALVYVHERNMTHRDISPGNILVQSREREEGTISVVLSDFGFSKEGSELVTRNGTPRYCAPEVYGLHPKTSSSKSRPAHASKTRHALKESRSHSRRYTNAIDIWSLGVVVLEMAFCLPQCDAATREWFDAVVNEARTHSSWLGRTLKQMLVWDPEERVSTTGCLHLAKFLLHEHQDNRPSTPRYQRDTGATRRIGSDEYQLECSEGGGGRLRA